MPACIARRECALACIDKGLRPRDNNAPVCSLSTHTMPVGILNTYATNAAAEGGLNYGSINND